MARLSVGRSWKRIILLLFIVFAGCNHSVRVLSGSNMGIGSNSMFDLRSTFVSSTLSSMNDVRQAVGGTVQKIGSYCPNVMGKVCKTTAEGFNVALGTY